MDLALEKIPMEGYACPLETTLFQEETQESIVPDACPDIGSILCTECRCELGRKECVEGKLECGGTIQATVVYLPDGEASPRRLELTIPFRATAAGGVNPDGVAVVVPRVTAAQTRALNPRKVLCRVELAIACQVWSPREESLCAPCQESECALQQRAEELETYAVMAVAEKSFAFTDDVTLPAGQPAVEELLGHRLELRCSEAKVIGNKLIFKGEALLRCRYRTGENTMALGRWDLPFSQIMEVSGVEEEGSCAVEVVERESRVTLSGDGDGRTLGLHMELVAQAVVRQTRTVRIFSDAYSITHDLTVERQERFFTQLWEESAVTQVCRETVETPQSVRGVEDCFVDLGTCQVKREEQEGVMTVQGNVSVLYTDESGQMCALSHAITASARVALPPRGECRARCSMAGELQVVATATGLEIRCPVQFDYLTTLQQPRQTVVALQAEEREAGETRPSVVLRLAQPGEGLWDIAKAYATTQEDILAANELPDAEHLEGRLLLIPRSR